MNLMSQQQAINNPAIVGNKAARLALLADAGFRVPEFFVIAADRRCESTMNQPYDSVALNRALSEPAYDKEQFAVRSSSVDEDRAEHSFAGQYSSFLNVARKDVAKRIADVVNSANSPAVKSYREIRSLGAAVRRPAVILQTMIPADISGVAFGADPVTGHRDVAVIAAGYGLGDALVSGEVQGDTWRVGRRGRIQESNCADENCPVLTGRQVRRIARLVRRVGRRIGRPQDIEWALHRDEIYLLQSRDITTPLTDSESDGIALWDNSNIVESYGGVTTPLTYSVARSAYAGAYRHMGRAIGISPKLIRSNKRIYEQMIGLIDGRVYYNLLNWYRLLMQTPGFRYNKTFMEQMMGVTSELPPTALPDRADGARFAGLRSITGMLWVGVRLVARLPGHRRQVARFHQKINGLLAPVPLRNYSLAGLIDYYEELQDTIIPAWKTPLLNDLFCMIAHGSLRKLCAAWLPEPLVDVHNELLCGDSDIISLEPVTRMLRMAEVVRNDEELRRVLATSSAAAIEQTIDAWPEFAVEYRSYIQRFGDRCLDELKLESPTLADDPLPMLRSVAQMAGSEKNPAGLPTNSSIDGTGAAQVKAAMRGRPLRRFLFAALLSVARGRVRDRENLRFERTRVYGRVRAVFVEVGRRLAESEIVERADDVFYVTVDEISGCIHGTGPGTSLRETAALRRAEFAAYRQSEDPPRRFSTCGPPQFSERREDSAVGDSDGCGELRSGQACSPGIVRGRVRIVKDPRNADLEAGDILVAERTDPGWVTVFPLAAGMIMERGSLLSHSAIVARELGLPCVVGVDNVCRWLRDGEWVEINGSSGTIRRLQFSEAAA